MTFREESAGRKRLAKLWGVAPYRVEVNLSPAGTVNVTLDGAPLTPGQEEALATDIRKTVDTWCKNLN